MAGDSLVLKTVFDHYGWTEALRDGRVTIPGVTLEFVEFSPAHKAFKPMVERLEFDVCEMALTTYTVAKAFDKKLTLLPIVLLRNFHFGQLKYNVRSGIREPKDLEGRKVGVRAYAQTTPVWVRGLLNSEYGVDLEKVTWVTFEGSHVAEYQDPSNVVRAPEGKKLNEMLAAGEIDAAIGKIEQSEDIKGLIQNPNEVAAAWFKKTGVYPINHMVTVKSDLVRAHPWLARALYEGFQKAKEIYVEDLYKKGPSSPADELQLRLKEIVGGDPLPYGVESNRKPLEMLLDFAHRQKLLPKPFTLEEVYELAVMELA